VTLYFENIMFIILKSKAGKKKKTNNVLILQKLSENNKIINSVIFNIRKSKNIVYLGKSKIIYTFTTIL
jgi:hypothetical protein